MKISLMCACLLDQYLPSLFVQVFESNNICIIEGLKHNYHKPQTFNPNISRFKTIKFKLAVVGLDHIIRH